MLQEQTASTMLAAYWQKFSLMPVGSSFKQLSRASVLHEVIRQSRQPSVMASHLSTRPPHWPLWGKDRLTQRLCIPQSRSATQHFFLISLGRTWTRCTASWLNSVAPQRKRRSDIGHTSNVSTLNFVLPLLEVSTQSSVDWHWDSGTPQGKVAGPLMVNNHCFFVRVSLGSL